MKLYLLLLLLLAASCGRKEDEEVGTIRIPYSPAQVDELKEIREFNESFAPVDADSGIAREAHTDGDAILWSGLVVSSGEVKQEEPAKRSIRGDGLVCRSPARCFQEENASSRDMFLGALALVIKTRDKELLERILSYVTSHSNTLCDNATDNRCDLNALQYRGIWGLVLRTCRELGVEPPFAASQADILDDSSIEAESFNEPGYTLHLPAVKVYLRDMLNTRTDQLSRVAERIRNSQPENAFFEYLASGKSERTRELVVKYCDLPEPGEKRQWTWQREMNLDKGETPWLERTGWECVFLINLLIGAE